MIEKKFLILLLEDSEYQTEQIIEFLKKDTLLILAAETIKEAKKILHDMGKNIDLLILDLKLPDGNGLDFLRFARKSHLTIPAIITSAYISANVHRDGDRLQVHNYLEKPLSMNALQSEVDTVLSS
ncbi:MAG: response regulator [Candidatus Cloacimonetes bacterium]|nr:response regulator [Candidatus Cloacimonadota bacterium]